MEEREYIIHYIKRNYEKKTIDEMVEGLGPEVTRTLVYRLCDKLNLTPITPKKKRVEFIKSNYKNMTDKELCSYLKIGKDCLIKLMKEIGIREESNLMSEKESLIDAAKRILKNPDEYPDFQVSVAEDVRRQHIEEFK